MTKTKYAIMTIATILPLIALVPSLQSQTVIAQTDNSGSGDNSGSAPSFGDRHPTLCAVGPSGLGLLGHPFLGYALHWWCNNAN
jgi:hypothetical protein